MNKNMTHYNNNFDILRLMLSISVFFAHWNVLTWQNLSNPIFHMSGYAVDMFFIVSGFLIFWSFENNQKIKEFYTKRFFRIFPLYGILIVLQTLFFIFYSNAGVYELLKYFVSNIVFLNFLSHSAGTIFSQFYVDAINGSLWTLKNEVMFYAILPFAYMLYRKFGYKVFILLYILSILYMFVVSSMNSHISQMLILQFPAQGRLFLAGIFLYIFFDKINKKNIYWLLIIGVVSIVVFDGNNYFRFSIYPIMLSFIVIYLTYFVKKIKINFDFSYSFYILHFPVIQLALYFDMNPTNPILSFIGLFSTVLILSYFSEKYIEKKFIQLGKNIIQRNKSAAN